MTPDERDRIIERLTGDYDMTSKWQYRQDILRLLAALGLVAPRAEREAMTDDLRALIVKWRNQADVTFNEHSLFVHGWDAAKRQSADELEALLWAVPATPEPSPKLVRLAQDFLVHCGDQGHPAYALASSETRAFAQFVIDVAASPSSPEEPA